MSAFARSSTDCVPGALLSFTRIDLSAPAWFSMPNRIGYLGPLLSTGANGSRPSSICDCQFAIGAVTPSSGLKPRPRGRQLELLEDELDPALAVVVSPSVMYSVELVRNVPAA